MFTHIPLTIQLPELKEHTTSKGRTYTTDKGDVYPSITTMLGKKEKPQLENWKNMLGKNNAKKEMERCAKRGTAVHELIEKYLDNEEDFTRGYSPDFVKRFNQLKFQLNKIDNIVAQEVALYSDQLKIAGRVDCIGKYKGKLSIIDFKTSNNNKHKKHVEDYMLQCTFYALAWFEMTKQPIENIVILMSVEKGMVPLVFEDTIDKWVPQLLKRVDEFYLSYNHK